MSLFKSVLAAGLLATAGMAPAIAPAEAACLAGAKIDRSTATDARQKMEKAGFRQIHGLKKGCDNYWHAVAKKDGKETHVVLSPQGTVMPEGA